MEVDNNASKDAKSDQSENCGESNGSVPLQQNASCTERPTAKQYAASVSRWLLMYQAHCMTYYNMVVAPYYMSMGYAQASMNFNINVQNQQNSANIQPNQGVQQSAGLGGDGVRERAPQRQRQQYRHTDRGQQPPIIILAQEFTIPAIQRRIIAEIIDFVVLFSLKVGLTLFAIVYLGIGDETNFAMQFLVEEFDADSSLEDLQQVLALALTYRIFVCLYETIFLKNTFGRAGLGGATPGKYLLGLRVISCERVSTVQNRRVQVFLAENLTYTQAFFRALIKNFSMAFFFPACITVFFNPHHRATYEILTRTVVVAANSNTQVNNNNVAR